MTYEKLPVNIDVTNYQLPHKKSFSFKVKRLIKVIIFSPFLLVLSLLWLLVTFRLDGPIKLFNLLKFAWNAPPDIARERLTALKKHYDHARAAAAPRRAKK